MELKPIDKFIMAIKVLKPNVPFVVRGNETTEEAFNKVEWETGVDDLGSAISTTTCPHSEITWTKVKAEMDNL